jgi:hypothetical protein
VAAFLAAGTGQVVILATRTHCHGEVDRAEFVDEEKARVLCRRRNAAVGRRCVPAPPMERAALWETARLLPRGEDGGFAERFLEARWAL